MNTLEISKNKLQEVRKAEEYFNALATNIQLSGVDLKVIAISSVQENEGKSTTSTDLAVAFARAGYKTLLVDCDIRNSVMTGIFRSRTQDPRLDRLLSPVVVNWTKSCMRLIFQTWISSSLDRSRQTQQVSCKARTSL